jgi:hypothetical protein
MSTAGLCLGCLLLLAVAICPAPCCAQAVGQPELLQNSASLEPAGSIQREATVHNPEELLQAMQAAEGQDLVVRLQGELLGPGSDSKP